MYTIGNKRCGMCSTENSSESLNHDTRRFSFSSPLVLGLKRPTTNAFLFSVLKCLLIVTMRNQEVMLPVWCFWCLQFFWEELAGRVSPLSTRERSSCVSVVICRAHTCREEHNTAPHFLVARLILSGPGAVTHSALNILTVLFLITVTLNFKVQAKWKTPWLWSNEGSRAFLPPSRSWGGHTLAELPPLPWWTQVLFIMPSSFFCIYVHMIPNVGCYCVNKARISASCVISTPLLLCVCMCFVLYLSGTP